MFWISEASFLQIKPFIGQEAATARKSNRTVYRLLDWLLVGGLCYLVS